MVTGLVLSVAQIMTKFFRISAMVTGLVLSVAQIMTKFFRIGAMVTGLVLSVAQIPVVAELSGTIPYLIKNRGV